MLNRKSSPISSFVNSNGFSTPIPARTSTQHKKEKADVLKNFSPIITFKKANIMPSLKPIEIKSYSF
jgi:hypothetical protein